MPIKSIPENFDQECNATFGYRLTERMKEMGYRADMLGESIGVPRRTVANYMYGKVSPPLDTAKKLAAVLNCDVCELLE